MGLRFRRSFKIFPGVKLNFGKKSASVTIGGKLLRQTYSTTGKRTTSASIPGTGLYYTQTGKAAPAAGASDGDGALVLALIVAAARIVLWLCLLIEIGCAGGLIYLCFSANAQWSVARLLIIGAVSSALVGFAITPAAYS